MITPSKISPIARPAIAIAVAMPALGVICASWPANTPNTRHQIRPDLWGNPYRWIATVVEPFVKDGATEVLYRRPFGEWTIGDLHVDYDSLWMMLNHGDSQDSGHVIRMSHAMAGFGVRYPDLTQKIYLGAIQTSRLDAMLAAGEIKQWAEQIVYPIRWMLQITEATGAKFKFVIDYVSQLDADSAGWKAYCLLDAMFPGMIEMEATPSAKNEDQWGTPAWVQETLWADRVEADFKAQPERFGQVTRWLEGVKAYETHWADRGGLAAFIADCIDHGQSYAIADDLVRYLNTTLSAEREAVGVMMAERAKHEQNQSGVK